MKENLKDVDSDSGDMMAILESLLLPFRPALMKASMDSSTKVSHPESLR